MSETPREIETHLPPPRELVGPSAARRRPEGVAPAVRAPEVLAPAGNEEMMKAAVENGADAIFFGVEAFNARLRANNFRTEDLPQIMADLHERGVKGFLTLNTLIFSGELREAIDVLLAASAAGVDAIIVQDLGLAKLANTIVPELTVHASTQMTISSPESIRGAELLGVDLHRIVVPRELSLQELKLFQRDTEKELEVFVHGALCVAYSGQCLTSEALGGRSANRGECAQACRLPYDLIVDGQHRDLEDVKYLLSPKDLAAYEDVGELAKLGIASLKIEGRLKSPEYVAATVQTYRAAVDRALQVAPGQALFSDEEREALDDKLEATFSRGFTKGYLHEINHQLVVEGRFPKKRGRFVGWVVSTDRDEVLVSLEAPLKPRVKPGDGIVFDCGRPDQREEGGRIYAVRPLAKNGQASHVLEFERGKLAMHRIHAGDRIWKTSDPAIEGDLRRSFQGDTRRTKRPISIRVTGKLGLPLEIELSTPEGLRVHVTDSAPTEAAHQRPLTEETLQKQLGRLGDTPFELESLKYTCDDDLMVPMSRLNQLRRDAAELLMEKCRLVGQARMSFPERAEPFFDAAAFATDVETAPAPTLSVLCRTLEQVRACIESESVATIYTDFEDARLQREAGAMIRGMRGANTAPLFVPTTLRIMKPGEAGLLRKLLQCEPDGILATNLGVLSVLKSEAPTLPVFGDYSLNVSNHITAQMFRQHGLRFMTPSYDLNIDQLLGMLTYAPGQWFEVTLQQYMPMFHMEHCVFCRFLSEGTDFTNCGRPCDTHTIKLRDRMGYEHPVKADHSCRNTVFNAVPQSAVEYLSTLIEAGIQRYRLDLLEEGSVQTSQLIELYRSALSGDEAGRKLWKRLRVSSKLGVTRGPLDHE